MLQPKSIRSLLYPSVMELAYGYGIVVAGADGGAWDAPEGGPSFGANVQSFRSFSPTKSRQYYFVVPYSTEVLV